MPGIGVWTAAEVAQRAWGDADAVSFGDFHIPNTVAWALAEALAATQGDIRVALPRWERHQLAVGRAVLERARRNGNKSQFQGTWRPGDPELVFGLYEPGR